MATQVWSGSTGELVFNLCKQVQPVYSLAPSPDGDYIATGSLGGNVAIWSLAQGHCLREVQGSGDTFDVSWSADGSLLCSCFSSGTLCVLDTTAIVSSSRQTQSASAASAPAAGAAAQTPAKTTVASSGSPAAVETSPSGTTQSKEAQEVSATAAQDSSLAPTVGTVAAGDGEGEEGEGAGESMEVAGEEGEPGNAAQ